MGIPVRASQLVAHRGERVELAGAYGSIAALRARPLGTDLRATVLLLPGYTGSKEDFAPLLDAIADAGLLALAVDLPGQYESAGPPDEHAYRAGPLGGVIAELIGKLATDTGTVLLAGHSFGGLVARAAILAGAHVGGLTLLDSGPGELAPGWRRQMLVAGEPILREQGTEAIYALRRQLDSTLHPGRPAPAGPLVDFLHTRFVRSTVSGLLGMGHSLLEETDQVTELAEKLRGPSIPCLVVCGEHDDAWPPAAQRDMAERLDADFAVIPHAAHSPNTENPEALLNTLLPTWRAWLS